MSNYAIRIFPKVLESIENGLRESGFNPDICWVAKTMSDFIHIKKLRKMECKKQIFDFVEKFVWMHCHLDESVFSGRLKEQGSTSFEKTFRGSVLFESAEDEKEFILFVNAMKGVYPDGKNGDDVRSHFGIAA